VLLTTDDYVFFYYGDDIYSNFYRQRFEMAGQSFFCSEQAMMYCKAMFFRDYDTAAKIMAVNPDKRKAPFECKMLGREVSPYNDEQWASVRYDVMCKIVYAKFNMDEQTRWHLIRTGNRVLVEASPTDVVWGVGMDVDHPDILDSTCWRGLNLLGNALMWARDKMIDEKRLP